MSYEIKSKSHHMQECQVLGDFLMEKTSAVFGHSAPELINSEHAGIPYKTRKRAYMNYAGVKAQEPKTGLGTALLTGGAVGGVLGAAAGGGGGALAGMALGGLAGAVMKGADDMEIDQARAVVSNPKNKDLADDIMAYRMARHARMEKAQDRAENRANAYMVASAVRSRPTRVNNYKTQAVSYTHLTLPTNREV